MNWEWPLVLLHLKYIGDRFQALILFIDTIFLYQNKSLYIWLLEYQDRYSWKLSI